MDVSLNFSLPIMLVHVKQIAHRMTVLGAGGPKSPLSSQADRSSFWAQHPILEFLVIGLDMLQDTGFLKRAGHHLDRSLPLKACLQQRPRFRRRW